MPFRLSSNGKVFVLNQRVSLVGRNQNAQLRIDHPSVSKDHAVLEVKEFKLFIQDLGSLNGTKVNGVKILANQSVELELGDRIVFGKQNQLFQVQKGHDSIKEQVRALAPSKERPLDRKIKLADFKPFKKSYQHEQRQQPIEPPLKLARATKETNQLISNRIKQQELNQLQKIKQRQMQQINSLKQSSVKLEKEFQTRLQAQKEIFKRKEKQLHERQALIRAQEQQLTKELSQARKDKEAKQKQLELRLKQQDELYKKARQKQQKELQDQDLIRLKQLQQKRQAQRTMQEQLIAKQQAFAFKQVEFGNRKQQLQQRKIQIQLEGKVLNEQFQQKYRQTIERANHIISEISKGIEQKSQKIQVLKKRSADTAEQVQSIKQNLNKSEQQLGLITYKNKTLVLYANQLLKRYNSFCPRRKQAQPSHDLSQLNRALRERLRNKLQQQELIKLQIRDKLKKIQTSGVNFAKQAGKLLDQVNQSNFVKARLDLLRKREKQLSDKWDVCIKQNFNLKQTVKSLRSHLQKQKSSMQTVLRQQFRKTNELNKRVQGQMKSVSEQEQDAADFLIQEMKELAASQEQMFLENQELHQQIEETFFQIQTFKLENDAYAQIIMKDSFCQQQEDIVTLLKNRLLRAQEQQRSKYAAEGNQQLLQIGKTIQELQLSLAKLEAQTQGSVQSLRQNTYRNLDMSLLNEQSKKLWAQQTGVTKQQEKNQILKQQLREVSELRTSLQSRISETERTAMRIRRERLQSIGLPQIDI